MLLWQTVIVAQWRRLWNWIASQPKFELQDI